MDEGRYLHDAAIGARFSRNARFGRRFLEEWEGAIYFIRGRRYIKESDFLQWIESRRIEPKREQPSTDLKAMLKKISDDVLKKRAS